MIRVTVIATGFEGGDMPQSDADAPRYGRRERAERGDSSQPSPAAPRRREPVETTRPTITLEQSERKGFEIPDDALEIPDFLK